MFVSFDLNSFLIWVFISTFIPGAILSLSIFRKTNLLFIEKLFLGGLLGIIILPLLPFLLYLFVGVEFSYSLAIISVVFLYAIAILFAIKEKLYEDLKLAEEIKIPSDLPQYLISSKSFLLALSLILLAAASFMIRASSYSPIYAELDPYYYSFVGEQILTLGHNPVDDKSAWYPEVTVNHREIPNIAYLQSIYYSLYTSGAPFDNMLFAIVASLYPPLISIFYMFAIYLFVSVSTKKKWGVVAAGLSTFAPILIVKMTSGVHTAGPYTFFAIAALYASYSLAIKERKTAFYALAILCGVALNFGTNSFSLISITLVLFTILHALALLFSNKIDELKSFSITNAIILGGFCISKIIMDYYRTSLISPNILMFLIAAIIFSPLIYYLKNKYSIKDSYFVGILIIGAIVVLFSPIGSTLKSYVADYLSLAAYARPLDRTIAEQALVGSDLSQEIGIPALTASADSFTSFVLPLKILFPQLSIIDTVAGILSKIFSILLFPFSAMMNLILFITTDIIQAIFGTKVPFSAKDTSFLLFWMFIFTVSVIYWLLKFKKSKNSNLVLLFFVALMLPFFIGIIKARLETLAAFAVTTAVGFSLASIDDYLTEASKSKNPKLLSFIQVDEKTLINASKYLFWFGAFLVLAQFCFRGFPVSILWASFQPIYQNTPDALAAKFSHLCEISHDADVCSAASDPIGYASKSTNNQYNNKLCIISVIPDPTAEPPSWQLQGAYFRCQRISTYWIDSMEWIKQNTESNARITSWWDYGHWTNYFGQRNTVLRNEHASLSMIGQVASAYVDGTPQELTLFMKTHESQYALFDMEILSSGNSFGGKFGALNYLGCAYNNLTNVSLSPGQSQCEADHTWENIFISSQKCTISATNNKTGVVAYKFYIGNNYLPYYPEFCSSPKTQNDLLACNQQIKAVPTYCVGDATLADGKQITTTYYSNETYPNGDLKLNKAFLQFPANIQTSHFGQATMVTLIYSEDKVWFENGEIKSGYEDRKGEFYDSNIYKALILNDIPGFKQVYSTNDGMVKIYKIAQ